MIDLDLINLFWAITLIFAPAILFVHWEDISTTWTRVMSMTSDGYEEWMEYFDEYGNPYWTKEQREDADMAHVVGEDWNAGEEVIVPNAQGASEVEEECDEEDESTGFDMVMAIVTTKDLRFKYSTLNPSHTISTSYCKIKDWRETMADERRPFPVPDLKHVAELWSAY